MDDAAEPAPTRRNGPLSISNLDGIFSTASKCAPARVKEHHQSTQKILGAGLEGDGEAGAAQDGK